MLKSPVSALYARVDNCIKNVYSLRTQTGTTSDQLHTGSVLTSQFTFPTVHKSLVIRPFVQAFAPSLSTVKISHFNLLNRRLYPQSTAPINKKKKERKEMNT